MTIPTQRLRHMEGFTLVELMVTIVVATILITIAVPSYTNQIRHSHRAEAKTALLDLAQREERYMSTNSSYTTTAGNLGYASMPVTLTDTYYTLSVTVTAATPTTPATFTAIAKAAGAQLSDTQCQTFTVDQTGNQTSAPGTTCWTN